MADLLGLGMFHGPQPALTDDTMANIYFRHILNDPKTPDALRDPANWPEGLRAEWSNDEGVTAARRHREETLEGCRLAREAIDEFEPDIVVIFADDQYENFKQDVIPPFCVYAADEFPIAGFEGGLPPLEGPLKPVARPHPPVQETVRGSKSVGTYLADQLVLNDFDVACSWELHHVSRLTHAFSHSIDYLDWERKGFDYPVIPFHISCYGTNLRVPTPEATISFGRLMEGVEVNPPESPTPRRCYDLGKKVGEVLAASPFRAVIIGSASWSHASLTDKYGYLWGDVESDRAHLEELAAGDFAKWREMSAIEMQEAGQHEMRNWIALAGAMEGKDVDILAYAETYVFNSSKCVALFQ